MVHRGTLCNTIYLLIFHQSYKMLTHEVIIFDKVVRGLFHFNEWIVNLAPNEKKSRDLLLDIELISNA